MTFVLKDFSKTRSLSALTVNEEIH